MSTSASARSARLDMLGVVKPADDALAAIDGDACSEFVIHGTDGEALIPLLSRRANARLARWGGDARLPALDLTASGVRRLPGEPDLDAYLGAG